MSSDKGAKPRARLKIFFGMAPGVGKTSTMLKVARELQQEGVEVVVGAVESHDQEEVLALMEGFEKLPGRTLPCRGAFLEEFDLQAAIARKPRLILMDNLSHVNVQGSMHQHRWQDVWDLLDAGIDVFTTLNVQNLESLRDVVTQITGLIVQDTVPDSILHRANEIEIVDIPPDELIERLRDGQVHLPEHQKHATERFFRKGNLMALRELALRRVAEHVDADMRRYMNDQGIAKTWAAGERLMVCISPHESSAKLIRAAKRMADALDAAWTAVYVENVRGLRHTAQDRAKLEEHLRLAERLGGETLVVQGGVHIAQDVVNLAMTRNATRILVGKSKKSRLRIFLFGSLLSSLIRRSGDMDVILVGTGEKGPRSPVSAPVTRASRAALIGHLAWAAGMAGLATGLGMLLARRFEMTEVVMVYLLAILIAGLRFGRVASVATSIFSVIAMDLVFVPPALSFQVDDLKHVGTFSMMLVVGYFIGNLVERIHAQTRLARNREQKVLALFRLSEDLRRCGSFPDLVKVAVESVSAQFKSGTVLWMPGEDGRLQNPLGPLPEGFAEQDRAVAQWCFDHQEPAGRGMDILPDAGSLAWPLKGTQGILGVMSIRAEAPDALQDPHRRHLLGAFADQVALALERAMLAEKASVSQARASREDVKNALLVDVWDDLHEPMNRLGEGLSQARSLAKAGSLPSEWLEAMGQSVHLLRHQLANLEDATRLESGSLTLEVSEVSLAALVTSACEKLGFQENHREVRLELPPKLPVVKGDARLLERVLVHLLENADRFSPRDQPIEVKGWATQHAVTLAIADHGTGIPEGREERIFERLARPTEKGHLTGSGLGLAICKGFVEAHGGWIQAGNRPAGGAQFLVNLPLQAG